MSTSSDNIETLIAQGPAAILATGHFVETKVSVRANGCGEPKAPEFSVHVYSSRWHEASMLLVDAVRDGWIADVAVVDGVPSLVFIGGAVWSPFVRRYNEVDGYNRNIVTAIPESFREKVAAVAGPNPPVFDDSRILPTGLDPSWPSKVRSAVEGALTAGRAPVVRDASRDECGQYARDRELTRYTSVEGILFEGDITLVATLAVAAAGSATQILHGSPATLARRVMARWSPEEIQQWERMVAADIGLPQRLAAAEQAELDRSSRRHVRLC